MRLIMLLTPLVLSQTLACADPGPDRRGQAESPALPPTARPELKASLEPYRIGARRFEWSLTRERQERRYDAYALRLPSAVESAWEQNNTVHAKLYMPTQRPKPVPAVVILHHLGGSFEAEDQMARHFARCGVAAAAMSLPLYGARRPKALRRGLEALNPERLPGFMRQAVHDARAIADMLRSLPEVDGDRVSLLGVSLGAIVGGLSAGVDGRFHRVVLVLGGGRLEEVFLNDAPELAPLRAELARRGLDRAKLKALAAPVDPVTFAHRVPAESVLMLNASNDEVIPRACTEALHAAFGKPEIHWYRCGHYGAALHIFNVLRRSLRHLRS